MSFATDFNIVFDDFGISATISELNKADKQVKVLFDLQSLGDMGILTDKPQATLKESDLAGVDLKYTTITINNITYRLIKPLPDGMGLIIAGLARV